MISKEIVERILRVNGVDATAPDEEIRSVLLSAKWHEKDVETALVVLRENTTTHEQKVDALHQVFRSDSKLQPDTITALLGIETTVGADKYAKNSNVHTPESTTWQMVKIILVSVLFAILVLLIGMWHFEIGAFHDSYQNLP